MTTLTLELPESVFSATRNAPDDFKHEMRLTTAVAWYEEGRVSQEIAAEVAGMDRTDFLLALARLGRDSFVVDFQDLDREMTRG
jgi:predicted HTH domain antitoxin